MKRVLLIKQYERNSKQLNFILNQINVIIFIVTIGDTENWADVSFSCQNF
jgi:hypothetical protein